MIDAKELRIGNCVYGFKTIWQVQGDDFHFDEMPFDPIPLTTEILEKCGFGKILMSDNFYRYFLEGVTIDLPYFEYVYDNGDYNTEVKFVHQLQNLYFALTGAELIIKL